MKESGIIWIGSIPDNWKLTTYRRLFHRRRETDSNPNKTVLSLTVEGVKIRDTNISFGKMATDYTGHQIVKKGDLIFTPRDFDATPILSGISPCDGCISNLYLVLIPNDDAVLPEFYNYFMWGVKWGGDIWKQLSYGMRYSYNYSQFASLPTVLPPLDEQKTIVAHLDLKTKQIDGAISHNIQLLQKYKQFKIATIENAVLNGIKNQQLVTVNVKWIGSSPVGWSVKKIGSLYYESNESGDSNLPFLTVSINSGISDRELSNEEQDRVFIRSEDVTKNKRVQPNDLAYNMMRAWQGAFGATKVEGMISSAYVVARPKVKICSKFMEWLLRTPNAMEEIRTRSHGIADFRLRLYWDQFKNIRVSIPSYEEQLEIVETTEKKLDTIDEYISKIERHIELLNEYKQSLIYEKVTGRPIHD